MAAPLSKTPKHAGGTLIHIEPIGALDQPTRLPNLEEMLERVDTILDGAVEKHDLRIALSLANDLDQGGRMFGLSLARTLYRIKNQWKELYAGDEEFEDEMYLQLGKDPMTISRYIGAWGVIESANEEAKELLKMRPIQDIIAVHQHENAHGVLEPEELLAVSRQPDTRSVRNQLREISGRTESKHVHFVLKRDGTLEAWGNGNVTTLGFIRRDKIDMTDALRRRAIHTLINRASIQLDGTIPGGGKGSNKRKKK